MSTDTSVVRAFVPSFVSPDDFSAGTLPAERQAIIERQAYADRSAVPSCGSRSAGPTAPCSPPTTRRFGARAAAVARVRWAGTGDRPGRYRRVGASDAAGPRWRPTVVREYFPLSLDGKVVGIVGVWRDAAPILASSTTSAATS